MAVDETMVRVRMRADLVAEIDAAAKRLDKTRSDYIRDAVRVALTGRFFVAPIATGGQENPAVEKPAE